MRTQIIGPTYRNEDEIVASTGAVKVTDGYLDETGALHSRPGLSLFYDSPQPNCNGLFYWPEKSITVAVCGSKVYAVASDGTATDITPSLGTDQFNLLNQVVFATTQYWVFMANGTHVLCWNGDTGTDAQRAVTPSDLTTCTHLAYLDGYVIAANSSGQDFYYTDLLTENATTPPTWNAVGLTAEGVPDRIRAMSVGWREIVLVGDRSTEIWFNQGGDPPFARMEGAFIEQGISAPNSLVNADNTWIWLNHERRVIRLEGRTPKIISTPYESQLRNLSTVSDAFSTILDHFYILSFPTDNRTMVYDLRTGNWVDWGKWVAANRAYDRYLGQAATYAIAWNKWLIAGRDGTVYQYRPDLFQDAGAVIRLEYLSAHYDHGTVRRKRSEQVLLRMKRGN